MFNWLINMFDMILHTFAQKTLVKVQIPGQTPIDLKRLIWFSYTFSKNFYRISNSANIKVLRCFREHNFHNWRTFKF
jgi:hypothetical protein